MSSQVVILDPPGGGKVLTCIFHLQSVYLAPLLENDKKSLIFELGGRQRGSEKSANVPPTCTKKTTSAPARNPAFFKASLFPKCARKCTRAPNFTRASIPPVFLEDLEPRNVTFWSLF